MTHTPPDELARHLSMTIDNLKDAIGDLESYSVNNDDVFNTEVALLYKTLEYIEGQIA